MPLFGSHLSIAGGHNNAIVAATELGCRCVQIFTKSPSQWAARPITEAEAAAFREVHHRSKLRCAVGHDSYLINLAAPDRELYRRSVEAFIDELRRAELLGLDYLVTHPGAHCGSGEEAGLARVIKGINEVHRRCRGFRVRVLLETTAGQGTTLGHRFEHLQTILAGVADPNLLGVCLDTCHVFAAGYALWPNAEYRSTLREFDRLIGLHRLRVFHLNDSRKPLGSRVDRHAHIGHGCLGLEPFRLLVRDRRFRTRPMILETPKENDMDRVNLGVLRELAS